MRNTLFSALSLLLVSTAAHAADSIGVAACDDYVTKYQACLPKIPDASRATYQQQLDSMQTAWKGMAANPTSAAVLPQVCSKATDGAKQAMANFGCTF